jgi:hypothetical protein
MSWRSPAFLAAMLTLTSCSSSTAATSPAATARTSPTPLTSVIAAASCSELRDRLFSLSSDNEIVDTWVWVKQCTVRVERDELTVVADASAWMAVDRDFGAVGVHEFVHATVHTELELQARARYLDGRLEVTLVPKPGYRVAVEPVGVLELVPLNWASFLAIELAPAAGASPEALAKARLREEVERTLAFSLATPLLVTYDARRGTASLGSPKADGGSQRLRIARHGTGLLGPFPPSSARSSAVVRVDAGHQVLMRPVCRTHAQRMVDADRRGDAILVDDWIPAEGDAQIQFAAMPCAWMLALRTTDGSAVVEVESLHVPPLQPAVEHPDRWVSVDEVLVDGDVAEPDTVILITSDSWSTTLFPRGRSRLPAVTILAPDERLSLQARRADRGSLVTIAEARVPLDTSGDLKIPIALTASDGSHVANVSVHARVRHLER